MMSGWPIITREMIVRRCLSVLVISLILVSFALPSLAVGLQSPGPIDTAEPAEKIDPQLLNLTSTQTPVNVLVQYRDELGYLKSQSAL